jgi:hypothetical protein
MGTRQTIAQLTARLSRLEEESQQTRTELEALAANQDGDHQPADSTDSNGPARISRRAALLKAAAAGAGGLALGTLARPLPVAAANGDAWVIGNTGTVTGTQTATSPTGLDVTTTVAGSSGVVVQGLNGPAIYGTSTTLNPGLMGSSTFTGPLPPAPAGGARPMKPQGGGPPAEPAGIAGLTFSNVAVGGYFTSGRAHLNFQPALSAGPPTTGVHHQGDLLVDSNATIWVCAAAGTPGRWVPVQQGGFGNAVFQAVSNLQYNLTGSDGVTWRDIDTSSGTPLILNLSPTFSCVAVLSANSDLWTANAGYNQDIGIFISGGGFGTGQIIAWKESGGFAGTFSPNAAFVETMAALTANTPYVIKLQWKTNKPQAAGAKIYAGAGGGAPFSPTRLGVQLIVAQ